MSVSLRAYIFILFIILIQIPSQYVSAQENLTTGLIKEDFSSLRYSFPIAENWSFEKLSRALLYAREIGSTAVVVMHDGQLVLEWGKTNLRIKSHSVRKSLLSALYGIAVEKSVTVSL